VDDRTDRHDLPITGSFYTLCAKNGYETWAMSGRHFRNSKVLNSIPVREDA
jgi:hypothetical protein